MMYMQYSMLKADYDRAVSLSKSSIERGFDLTDDHAAEAGVPFSSIQSLRRQMFSRSEGVRMGQNVEAIVAKRSKAGLGRACLCVGDTV